MNEMKRRRNTFRGTLPTYLRGGFPLVYLLGGMFIKTPFYEIRSCGWFLFIYHAFLFILLFYMIPPRPYLPTLWETRIGVISEQAGRFVDIASHRIA